MQSFQTITIGGHMGRDPDMRYTQDGIPVLRFSVAVGWRRPVRQENGQQQGGEREWEDKTTWYTVTMRGNRAESMAPKLEKGLAVIVVGRIQPDIWINRDNVANLDMNLFANEIYIADRSDRPAREGEDGEDQEERPARASRPAAAPARGRQDDYEDLPF